jgi:hypothetical protein
MEKVVSVKALKYEQMYRNFFKEKSNLELSKHVFFMCDNRLKKITTSKIS